MNKFEKFFLYITSALFFLSMFFMFSFSVTAASVVDGELPYIVPNFQSVNTAINDSLMESTYQQLLNANKIQSDDTVLFFVTDLRSNLGQYEWNQMVYVCNPVVSTDVSANYNYLTTSMTLNCDYYGSIEFKWNNTFRNIGQTYGSISVLGNTSTIDISQGSYTPRYPFYLIGNDIYYGDILVFTNTVPFTPDIPSQGHATQPTNDPNNFINGSNGLPVTRPTSPTINNYTWNTWTSPSVDTSSVETLLESLIDVVSSLLSWLGSNISGEFNNLVSNLQNLFDFLVQGIENCFNKVISSIQGLGTDLYNNFVSLFEPITQQLSYISAAVDTELIQGEVESTSLMSDYSEVVSIKDSFVSVFTDTSEPSSFTIPIHLENLSILNVGIQYIDLSVINPVKSALRTFIWVLVSFGLVVTIIDSIPNYINGGGDE